MPSVGELRELRTALKLRAPGLRVRAVEERAEAIARACTQLLARQRPAASALRADLLRSTGLSAAGIEHGLHSTLGLFTRDALLALHAEHEALGARAAEPARATDLAVVVLAGNVFSAAARPLLLPLLCGSTVLLKAASTDDVLPRALQRALAEVDSQLGAACAVVTFGREEAALRDALIADADVLSVYGDDATVAAFDAIRASGTRLVAHGHGIALAFVADSALQSEQQARATAAAVARDVAAYDQRGCLSPHGVFVQSGPACDARGFALHLADALAALSDSWPRGSLPLAGAAAQLQWRGVAAVSGELHARASCAVAYAGHSPLTASPGYRNLSVYDCAGFDAVRERLAPLQGQLKALAVAGEREREHLIGLAPYVCAPGMLQEPPLAARLDGLHPCHGF